MKTPLSNLSIYVLTLALAGVGRSTATDFFVTNLIQFDAAVPLVQPGDSVILGNGVWTNANLIFGGEGTQDRPITLRAETSGKVLLTGTSRLHLAGSYLVAQGLVFTNGYPAALDVIEFQVGPYDLANNCRVTDCAIIDFNPPSPLTDKKWVSIYGFSNRVDHCYFKGKQNSGTVLIVWLPPPYSSDATKANYHQIDHNYFGPRPKIAGGNGGETIRVGDSDTCFNVSHTIVEDNYFKACDGEIEIISSKSGGNVYRYNTFVECAGTLTLRHGNGCLVEGNYFFGNDKPSTGGVRVIGEDHRVINNYFQNLAGSAGYSALVLMQGLENSPLTGYFQVRNANVAFNTLINCSNSFVVGLEASYTQNGTNRNTTLPPLNCMIANNIVFTTKRKLVDQRITPVNLTWQGNIMFGTTLGISPTPGIQLADPKLGLNTDGLWQPQPGSPALGAAQGSFGFVTDDIRGRLRPVAKDVGSDQANGSAPVRRPLTTADVGPSWMQPLKASLSLVNSPAVALRWASVTGAVYRVQTSPNLVTWSDTDVAITATGTIQTWEELAAPQPTSPVTAKFYRIKKISGPSQPNYSVAFSFTNRPCASLLWNCVPGRRYQAQVSTNLVNWQDTSPTITNALTAQRWEEMYVPGRAKFYRVKQLPD